MVGTILVTLQVFSY